MRHISLLEFQPGMVMDIVPPFSYIEKTNGTLVPETCRVNIDANGFMVSDKPYVKNDSKILLLGGSAIENLFIPADKRILARIETILASSGRDAKVYSAGVSDSHLLHMINLLLNKGIGLRPQCVVYYATPGLDIIANEADNSFWNSDHGINPLREAKEEVKIKFRESFANKGGFKDEKKLLQILCDVCKRFDIPLLMATWPLYGPVDAYMQKQHSNLDSFYQEEAQTSALNEVVRAIAREQKCGLIDLERSFADLEHGSYFYDWNHPNIKGCDLIASITSDAIKTLYLDKAIDNKGKLINLSPIIFRLELIFREILDNPDLVVTSSLTSHDVAEWDSLNNLRIIAAVEKRLAVQFTGPEVEKLTCVGDLAALIASKLQA
ncbi:hypothetical protein LMG28614_05627 [Paraburkholderia ultramafica]|uniref:SGNH/GDSL hydrolase family protein n=1 Tax=Paraburkholderia ultramafica TaxID=1544867 RepID=A0A6S7BXX4_9BURK|nr:acyl carrier protein [Paraburkholderia ultramafica]CAB3802512.1 hypothetical protein LMG28614_05627 [Paraburkholderia ultramafica]